MTVIFNLIGLGMLAAGFGVAFAVQFLSAAVSDDVVLLIAAPLLLVADLAYRHRDTSGRGWWYRPGRGGHFAFIPIWILGLFWMGLGTIQLLRS
jgi:hypothetical protein